jgi:hypothetical protein
VFGDVSTVASARATREEKSVAKRSLKPSIRSPPVPDNGDRPSKRIRFDLPPLVETAAETRTAAFGPRKTGGESLKPSIALQEYKKFSEVHSVGHGASKPLTPAFRTVLRRSSPPF